jgi:stringent starvation protein B
VPRSPIVDRTFRQESGPVNYWKEVSYYMGGYVVVYLPQSGRWKRAWLCGVLPHSDEFVIRWRKRGRPHTLKGIWRVHKTSLFALENGNGTLLPRPMYRDRLLPQSKTKAAEREHMATTSKTTGKTGAKKKAATAETNGSGTTRAVNDKLGGISDAKKRNIAKLITKERAKSPATNWTKIGELVKSKYDWDLPGSMTGRRLMREFGPDNAEDAIIKQERKPGAKKSGAKKSDPNMQALAGLSRAELKALIKEDEVEVTVKKAWSDDDIRTAIIGAGWTAEEEDTDEDEVDEDEEVDEDDEDEEDEDEPEDEADEDDEDEDDEEPTPAPKPVAKKKPAAKRVAVKRKPKAKPNPSK